MAVNKLYLDMDGVLCDFDKQFVHFTNEEPISFERKRGTVKFWEIITNQGVKFWNQMDPMPDFNILKKYITELSKNSNIALMTSFAMFHALTIRANARLDSNNIDGAIDDAKRPLSDDSVGIVVTGSVVTVGEARSILRRLFSKED